MHLVGLLFSNYRSIYTVCQILSPDFFGFIVRLQYMASYNLFGYRIHYIFIKTSRSILADVGSNLDVFVEWYKSDILDYARPSDIYTCAKWAGHPITAFIHLF